MLQFYLSKGLVQPPPRETNQPTDQPTNQPTAPAFASGEPFSTMDRCFGQYVGLHLFQKVTRTRLDWRLFSDGERFKRPKGGLLPFLLEVWVYFQVFELLNLKSRYHFC